MKHSQPCEPDQSKQTSNMRIDIGQRKRLPTQIRSELKAQAQKREFKTQTLPMDSLDPNVLHEPIGGYRQACPDGEKCESIDTEHWINYAHTPFHLQANSEKTVNLQASTSSETEPRQPSSSSSSSSSSSLSLSLSSSELSSAAASSQVSLKESWPKRKSLSSLKPISEQSQSLETEYLGNQNLEALQEGNGKASVLNY